MTDRRRSPQEPPPLYADHCYLCGAPRHPECGRQMYSMNCVGSIEKMGLKVVLGVILDHPVCASCEQQFRDAGDSLLSYTAKRTVRHIEAIWRDRHYEPKAKD